MTDATEALARAYERGWHAGFRAGFADCGRLDHPPIEQAAEAADQATPFARGYNLGRHQQAAEAADAAADVYVPRLGVLVRDGVDFNNPSAAADLDVEALAAALESLWRVRNADGSFVWDLPVPPNEQTAKALAAAYAAAATKDSPSASAEPDLDVDLLTRTIEWTEGFVVRDEPNALATWRRGVRPALDALAAYAAARAAK